MSNIKKIRQEIERLKNIAENDNASEYLRGQARVCRVILAFIDSLPEEKPSDDLEEAADEYYDNTFDELGGFAETRDGSYDIFFPSEAIRRSFIAGAEWQKSRLTMEDIKKIVNIADAKLDDPKMRIAIQNHSEEEYYQKVLDEYNRLHQTKA